MHNQQHQYQQLKEGLESGDLKRLVHHELHIDEFKSKLGRDEDVCVISFKVTDKEPAQDLVSFCEKGYPWVLDADVSSGEMDDGDYIVFVEVERNKDLPSRIMELIDDILRLTDQTIDKWRFRYHKSTTDHPVDENTLEQVISITPEDYKNKYGKEEIDKLKNAAGVKVTTKAPKNDFTEALRAAAGIL